MVLDKPTGIHTHPTDLSPDEISLIELAELALGYRLFPVHRLDRATSGVLIFTRRPETVTILQRAWNAGQVTKLYQALLRGWVPSQRVEIPLEGPMGGNPAQAVTDFRSLRCFCIPKPYGIYTEIRLTFADVLPLTGRWHQIRLHARKIRHPVVGDTKHGDNKLNQAMQEVLGKRRLWLHARRVEIAHPISGEPLVLESQQDLERELSVLDPYRVECPSYPPPPSAPPE